MEDLERMAIFARVVEDKSFSDSGAPTEPLKVAGEQAGHQLENRRRGDF